MGTRTPLKLHRSACLHPTCLVLFSLIPCLAPPIGESLGMCLGRVKPYWKGTILPSVRKGKRVLVAAHNNVIRCLCSHLDGINEANLEKLGP